MDGIMQQRTICASIPKKGPLATLFGEDFGVEHRALNSEVVEPSYSAADLAKIRETAWHDGRLAGLQEASAGQASVLHLALQDVATQIGAKCREAIAHAEQSA